MITSEMVRDLREKTGAGIVDCKKMLEQADGNAEKAIELLREKGLASAAKKSSRIASEGLVESYIHAGGKIGALVEVNCETDFVAKNDDFKQLVKDICLQVAAVNPLYVSRDEVPASLVEKEKEIYLAQAKNEGKPENIAEKIATGKLEKYYKEICLLDQAFIKDPDKTIQDLVTEKIAKIGEKISIRRFVRFERGEGMEKRQDNFAEEVMSQLK